MLSLGSGAGLVSQTINSGLPGLGGGVLGGPGGQRNIMTAHGSNRVYKDDGPSRVNRSQNKIGAKRLQTSQGARGTLGQSHGKRLS